MQLIWQPQMHRDTRPPFKIVAAIIETHNVHLELICTQRTVIGGK